MKKPAIFAALSLLLFSLSAVQAAPKRDGDLDPTFGGHGYVPGIAGYDLEPGISAARAVARQADGRLIIAGTTGAENAQHLAVLRLNADGSPDLSFGKGGALANGDCDHYLLEHGCVSVITQPDGKIIVGAAKDRAGELVRFLPDGTLDISFGDDGYITPAEGQIYDLLALPDGKFLSAGEWGIALRSSSGEVELVYSNRIIYCGQRIMPRATAVQSDGKVVAVGEFLTSCGRTLGPSYNIVARYLPDGSFDPTFGDNGVRIIDAPDFWSYDADVAVDAEGRVLVTSTSGFLMRLTAVGAIDQSFLGGGTGWRLGGGIEEVLVQPDGKYVILGGTNETILVRFNPDGSRDGTFANSDGLISFLSSDQPGEKPHALMLQPDGTLIAVGEAWRKPGMAASGYAYAARVTRDGARDQSFATNGVLIDSFPQVARAEYHNQANAVAVQPDGKILLGGSADVLRRDYNDKNTTLLLEPALLRLNADGSLDNSFGGDGRARLYTSPEGPNDSINAIIVLGDGSILAGGNSDGEALLVRLHADGTLDRDFGGDSYEPGRTYFRAGYNRTELGAMALLPDGKILVGGSIQASGNHPDSLMLARFSADGHLDTSFGANGLVDTQLDLPGGHDLSSMVVQPDGKIVIAANPGRIVRYNADGSFDSSFNAQPFWQLSDLHLLRLPDGRLLVGGITRAEAGDNLTVRRLLADGGIDLSFGTRGQTILTWGVTVDSGGVISLAGDKILISGAQGPAPTLSTLVLARLNADGSPDISISLSGMHTMAINSSQLAVTAMTRDNAGRPLLVGRIDAPTNDWRILRPGLLVTRFQPDQSTPQPQPTATTTPRPSGCLFRDVCPGDYYYNAVYALRNWNALSGYGDGSFKPFNNVTRGQVAKIVAIAARFPASTASGLPFSDVPASDPYYGYVKSLFFNGIISGYADRTFRPYQPVTRAQLAKIVVLAFQLGNGTPISPHFADVPADAPFYSYIEAAYNEGVISGYADGTFNPGGMATRGQVAKIVYLAATKRGFGVEKQP